MTHRSYCFPLHDRDEHIHHRSRFAVVGLFRVYEKPVGISHSKSKKARQLCSGAHFFVLVAVLTPVTRKGSGFTNRLSCRLLYVEFARFANWRRYQIEYPVRNFRNDRNPEPGTTPALLAAKMGLGGGMSNVNSSGDAAVRFARVSCSVLSLRSREFARQLHLKD